MSEACLQKEPCLLEVQGLKMLFPTGGSILGKNRRYVHAVDGVSFSLRAGETLGIVGESGCGKSTVGNLIVRLLKETEGPRYHSHERPAVQAASERDADGVSGPVLLAEPKEKGV